MPSVAIVVKGYPRLSETFIAQEILGLQRRGLDLLIVSLRKPTDPATHDMHREITAPVLYLPEYLKDDPKRVRQARKWARQLPTYQGIKKSFERDLARDPGPNRWRRWGQACVLAHELPQSVKLLYAHFLHTPSSVAYYAARLRRMPWTFSAHAKDIWTSKAWDLEEKIESAEWGVTCTKFNVEYLNGLSKERPKVSLLYHGLDFARFPDPSDHSKRDGTDDQPVRILSIGRPVAKKGYPDLLRALAALPNDLNWTFTHIGGKPEDAGLVDLASRLGISGRITWMGAQPRQMVIEACRSADLFALASLVTKNGDRDGLPNVLMEAQAVGLACLSTRVSAIPELIEDGETGLLVDAGDRAAMTNALERLIRDPDLRRRLGSAGCKRVRSHFSSEPGLDRLADMIRSLAGPD